MSKLTSLLLFLTSIFVTAQHTTMTIDDFNADGVEDRLKCSYEIGSAFGGTDCTLTDGKTNANYNLTNFGCYCKIKKHVVLSPELRKPENVSFLYALRKEVLPIRRITPDQSLLWIIKSSLTTQKVNDNNHFDLIFNPKSHWRKEKIELPSTYYIEMSAKVLSNIIPSEDQNQKVNIKGNDFLIYYGHSHFQNQGSQSDSLKLVAENDTYKILKTAHGVLVKKGDTYKWLFITDIDINGSPANLRQTSIEEVVLLKNHIILRQNLTPDLTYNIYLIDIANGMGGKLKINFDSFNANELQAMKSEKLFSVKDNTLRIGKKKHKLKFSLDEIKRDLSLLHKFE